jgi:hypothetical protein
MTLGQILFELHATQKRTDGRTEGRTDKGKSKCPPLKGGHKHVFLTDAFMKTFSNKSILQLQLST